MNHVKRPTDLSPVAFLAALAAMTSSWSSIRVGPLQLSDLLLIAALIGALHYLAAGPSKRPVQPWEWALVAISLFLLWRDLLLPPGPRTTFTVYVGPGEFETRTGASSFEIFARIVLSTAAISLLLSLMSRLPRDRSLMLLGSWYWGCVVSAMYAMLPLDHIGTLEIANQYYSVDRASGLAFHPNSLAQSLVLALPIGMYFLHLQERLIMRLLFVSALTVIGAGIYLSGSRAGIIVGVVAVVVTRLLLARRAVMVALSLTLVAILVANLSGVWSSLLAGTRLTSDSLTARVSDAQRMALLEQGWDLFAQNPLLGAGLGSWYGEMVPLIVATSGGIVFLVAYYSYLAVPLVRAGRLRSTAIGAATLGYMISLSIYGFFNNGLAERYLFWPMLLSTLFFATQQERSLPSPRTTREAL